MPVKKRTAKKRPVEEIREAWADYFRSGRQMLNGTYGPAKRRGLGRFEWHPKR